MHNGITSSSNRSPSSHCHLRFLLINCAWPRSCHLCRRSPAWPSSPWPSALGLPRDSPTPRTRHAQRTSRASRSEHDKMCSDQTPGLQHRFHILYRTRAGKIHRRRPAHLSSLVPLASLFGKHDNVTQMRKPIIGRATPSINYTPLPEPSHWP